MPLVQRSLLLLGFLLASSLLARADDAASRAIVDKAIERMGGEKQLAKFKATRSKVKGTIQLEGSPVSFTGDIATQGSDQHHVSLSLVIGGQSITFASVLNRTEGWRKINDSTNDMTAEELTESKENAYSGWVVSLIPLKEKAFQLAPFGEIEVAGRKLVGVNVTHEGRRSINLFFDKETYQLVRSETIVRDESTGKQMTEESTYSQFKEADGIHYPTKIVVKRNNEPFAEVEVESLKQEESLNDSQFAKP